MYVTLVIKPQFIHSTTHASFTQMGQPMCALKRKSTNRCTNNQSKLAILSLPTTRFKFSTQCLIPVLKSMLAMISNSNLLDFYNHNYFHL